MRNTTIAVSVLLAVLTFARSETTQTLWICHPEAQDKKRLYCKEHSLYEDECFLCHPESKKRQERPSSGAASNAPEDSGLK